MNKLLFFCLLAVTILFYSCDNGKVPQPYGPLPSQGQLNWHQLETYAFVHFNMNTFTGKEWGSGSEDPATFNPSALDCRQWVRIFKEAGMKGVIITAKHHDGFCLWPTSTTEHSVKNSPWKNGQGDVIRELSDACREAGLKFGVYLSPWDRNNVHYGSPEYINIFRTQLTELLTNYGDIFEVWFDGANGGSGYYGGANEDRSVDRKSYYDWPTTFALVHQLQPNTVIFSDAGPDVRWVGNESGYAGKTNWSLLRRDEFWPGSPFYEQLTEGHEDGTHWLPAEVDVPIRPGWYYHESEDNQVKTLPKLLDIYYHSVGRNASMLLNVPADKRGLITDIDSARLKAFKSALDADFSNNLAKTADVTANIGRGRDFDANRVNDDDNNTYWGAPDSVKKGILTFKFKEPVTINRILLQEPVFMGQRIQNFSIEALINGTWEKIAKETTIGYKRILRTADFTTSELRVNIERSKACPLISTVAFYHAPQLLTAPRIYRDKSGVVSFLSSDEDVEIHYTTDGKQPTAESDLYTTPFQAEKVTISAVNIDKTHGLTGPTARAYYDIAKAEWTLPADRQNVYAIDGDKNSAYSLNTRQLPADLIIDLNREYKLTGFTYLPKQNKATVYPIMEYEFYVSRDGKSWGAPVSSGEFSNIINSFLLQEKRFSPVSGRYIRLRALKVAENSPVTGIAEVSVITE